MYYKIIFILLILTLKTSYTLDPAIEDEEIRALNVLMYLNKRQPELQNKIAIATWNHESNITEETLKEKLRVVEETAKESKKYWEEIVKLRLQQFQNYDVKRQLLFYSYLGDAALPDNKYKKFLKITNDMLKVYSTNKICSYSDKEKCDLSLEPELTQILLKSNDPEELKYTWLEWRKATGPKLKRLYKDYVIYKNEAARLNHFEHAGETWLRSYETKDIKEQLKVLWEQIRPLYLQIHAYVRFKLREQYGDIVSEKGPIPAHLLGDMWAQTWRTVARFSFPFPNKTVIDVTDEMVAQGYTPDNIFKLAEDFFVSINLTAMPQSFWERSILEKPDDGRQLVCHPQSWDFANGKDFRIKQCTRITYESFKAAHHEMGHIQYFLQYKNQPYPYRRGANDAFHEAVGDIITLSASTMKHLRKIGLLYNEEIDNEIILNNLYKMGLEKIIFLPFAYIMESWRWGVFSGEIPYEHYNCKWWQLRYEYQGIEPPANRSEEDFDPAAKFHIIADIPYIKYFFSYIIQFQFHRTLCEKAGQYIPHNLNKPLHECDIFESISAGNALKKILEMGASRPWQDAMEALTGQRYMHAGALLEYFEPLRKWLEEENKKNHVHIGWESPTTSCIDEGKDE